MNKVIASIVVLLAMAVSLPSCVLLKKKGKKKKKEQTEAKTEVKEPSALQVNATLPDNVRVQPDANLAIITQLSPLLERRVDYSTFSGKAKVSMQTSTVSADFSANFRIAKDSLVWVHVTALGGLYPVARMLVTRDSFFMVDYTQKQVTMLPLADVGKVLPIAVQLWQLQNLIVGDPLSKGIVTSAEVKDSVWILNTEDTGYIQQLSYGKTDSNMVVANLQTRRPSGPQALLTYGSYEMVNERRLSVYRTVNVQNGINIYNLEMEIVNPEFDKQLEFAFSVPKNYTVKAIK